MSRHTPIKRTTVRINPALLKDAQREAAKKGMTVTSLIERGLLLALADLKTEENRTPYSLPVCTAGGGVLPGIDINKSSELLGMMDDEKYRKLMNDLG